MECAGPAVQLIPGKASTQRETKERRTGGNWEEGEGGKQSLKAWTSTPGEAQSSLLTSTSSSWAASTTALPSTSPMLSEHPSASQIPPEQIWDHTDQGRCLWGRGARFISPIMLIINLMTDLHEEMTKQPPHVSCPQDTDQLTLLSPCINNFARASLGNRLNLLPDGKGS